MRPADGSLALHEREREETNERDKICASLTEQESLSAMEMQFPRNGRRALRVRPAGEISRVQARKGPLPSQPAPPTTPQPPLASGTHHHAHIAHAPPCDPEGLDVWTQAAPRGKNASSPLPTSVPHSPRVPRGLLLASLLLASGVLTSRPPALILSPRFLPLRLLSPSHVGHLYSAQPTCDVVLL